MEGIFLSVDVSTQARRNFVERTYLYIHAMTERGGIPPSLLLESYRSVTTIWLAGSILHLPFMDYMGVRFGAALHRQASTHQASSTVLYSSPRDPHL